MDDDAALVVAGVSARAMAESAQRGGWRVFALDVFGDLDTRRASERWAPIGVAGRVAIDGERLLRELALAAREPGVEGWVAGSGFEALPEWLERGAKLLPLLGMPGPAVAALRDARRFFATLARFGLAFPEVSFEPPAAPEGWLVKDFGGTGGWHIRHAADAVSAPPGRYYQRRAPGTPMSALFVADGRGARIVALNRLLVRRLGSRPLVYRGAIGPIDAAALDAAVDAALAPLVPAFALRGLASLDFMAHEGTIALLEINPRPSASMVLHDAACAGGLMRAHVQAIGGALPELRAPAAGVRGAEILFAQRHCRIDADLAAALAGVTDCHDLPSAGAQFANGDPVCSVSAAGAGVVEVEQALAARKAWIHAKLATLPETSA